MARKRNNNKLIYIGIAVGFVCVTILATVGAFLLGDTNVLPAEPTMSTQEPDKQEPSTEKDTDDKQDKVDVFESGTKPKDEAKPSKDEDKPSSNDEDEQSKDKDTQDSNESTNTVQSISEEEPTVPIEYKRPEEMRAVRLVGGIDFLAGEKDSATVQNEINNAVASAVSLGMNTVIVDSFYDGLALHNTSSMPSVATFDILAMIINTAEKNNLYIYVIYDLSKQVIGTSVNDVETVSVATTNNVIASLNEFTNKYNTISGILFSGYYNDEGAKSYSDYMQNGSGMGYENYMKGAAKALFAHAAQNVKKNSPNVQAGLLIDNPWANKTENDLGSATAAEFTALADGNADTKAYIEDKLADFAVVEAYGSTIDPTMPFEEVASWWNGVASESNVPIYIEHASDKACSDQPGWVSEDQLMRQLVLLKDCSGISGSAFNSLPALVANPKSSTDAIVAYFNDNVKMDHILKDLVFTSPDAYNKNTFDKDIVIKGASDPTFPMYMDGEEIERDENGYFAIPVTLKPGDNVINFKHKDRDRTFHITRIVQIIKQVSPEGSMVVDGGMEVSVSVVAYGDAKLSASIGGTPFTLSADDTDEDEELRGTSYKRFKGTFTAPEATTSVQNLGQIVIKGTWDGFNDSKGGASVTVNKQVTVGDGVLVRVTASQAETFPTTKLNNISDPSFYPLPKGTMDYAVGNEVTYKEGSKSYTYYKLKSGLRVYSKDITATDGNLYENAIKGLRVDANKRYTVVTLNTAQPVPYKVMYTGDSIKFTFEYTKTVPSNLTLNKNPLFSSATWSGSTLTLKLARAGAFLGYKAEHTADGLVLTFNNPTSLSGARIVLDPGHGVKDQGASGFNPNYPESVINWEIAQKLAKNLQEAGATVKLITTRGVSIEPTMEQRLATARAFSPHIYMSIHSNSGGRTSVGSEAYYFYPFAKNLSGYASSEMASALNTTNRGNKYGLFYVTRESQFASVLCETGFVSSQSDYSKLIDSKYQERIANGLKNSINSFLKSTGGSGATGTQSTGSTTSTGGGLPKDEQGSSGETPTQTELILSETELSLKVGESKDLDYETGAGNKKVDTSWKTSDSDVATVSTSGKVKAVGKGTANITLTDTKSGSKAVCKVTVGTATADGIPAKSISLNLQELNIKADATATLIATIAPADATDKTVNWSSNAKATAKVDRNGTVTGLKEGSAIITATTTDGEYTAKCTVNVTGSSSEGSSSGDEVSVTGVTLDNKSAELKVGEKLYLSETVAPTKAANKGVTWESSDEAVATVSSSGKVVAVGEGEAAIYVITDDGEYKAKCIISVNK